MDAKLQELRERLALFEGRLGWRTGEGPFQTTQTDPEMELGERLAYLEGLFQWTEAGRVPPMAEQLELGERMARMEGLLDGLCAAVSWPRLAAKAITVPVTTHARRARLDAAKARRENQEGPVA